MHKIYQFFFALLVVGFLTACEEETDMAIDRVASPVLAVFGPADTLQGDVLSMKATFYELDKSGILDQQVGVDSIPVANMPVAVFINESISVGEITTNERGEAVFERDINALQGASRLEWVGAYHGTSFRIYAAF